MVIKRVIKFSIKLLIIIILIAGAIGSAISSVWTLVPDTSASKACMLGYKAHCSFTPISTIILVFISVLFTYILIRTKILRGNIFKI